MSDVSAKLVMELRQITGCGLMECKKALAEAGGDLQGAAEVMKKAGVLKAEKKSSRQASDGVVCVKVNSTATKAVMVEVNCETDFVAKDENFQNFVNTVVDCALDKEINDLDTLINAEVDGGESVEVMRQNLVLKIGENIKVSKIKLMNAPAGGSIGSYVHGVRLGALVVLTVADVVLGKDIAMHITANRPKAIGEEDFPQAELNAERELYMSQAGGSGKPIEIQEKIVAGRMKKYLAAHSLLEQPFVKDPDVNVNSLLTPKNAKVVEFECYALGEA